MVYECQRKSGGAGGRACPAGHGLSFSRGGDCVDSIDDRAKALPRKSRFGRDAGACRRLCGRNPRLLFREP